MGVLGTPPPAGFAVRTIAVAPGGERPYDAAEWHDTLVLLERGEIVLETLDGARWRFRHGAVLWLGGLPLRALRNRGHESAVLVAVTRGPAR